jgi:hypothetical protein
MCENTVDSNLMQTYGLSKAVDKFCFERCKNLDAPLYALEQQERIMF